MNSRKTVYILIVTIVIVLLVIAGAYMTRQNAKAIKWITYEEEDYDFQISYPSNWDMYDELTSETCCLVIRDIDVATTTALNASGTPVMAVTAREMIKLQVGYYDKKTDDPFKAATTTKVTLGKNEFHTGVAMDGTEFYLLPLSPNDGIGAAIFSYIETPPKDKPIVRQIISTIKLLPRNATSTKP